MLIAIKNDPKLIDWLNSVCLSETNNTRELYTTVMKKYCNLIGLTPVQLIEQVEKESSLPFSKQSLSSHIATFKNLLREKMSETSRITYLAVIGSFYNFHNVAMPKSATTRKRGVSVNVANTLSLKDEDITKAFSISASLMKLIIADQYTSGLSMSDILKLKAGDVGKNFSEDNITCLSIQRQKTKVIFHTFLSPTATKLSLEWIINMKLEDNDFLICETKGEQLKESKFIEMFRTLSEDMGFKDPAKGEYNKFHSHNLRKMFYNTILKEGGWAMAELAEYFMGHKVPAKTAAYLQATPETLKKEYMKFVPHFEKVLNPIQSQNPTTETGLKNCVELAKI